MNSKSEYREVEGSKLGSLGSDKKAKIKPKFMKSSPKSQRSAQIYNRKKALQRSNAI